MSRTDKTRPLWVQFRDPANRRFMEETHDHTNGLCDFDTWWADEIHAWWPRGYNCYLYHSYYGGWYGPFWPRPRKGSWDRSGRHGHVRAQWRRDRARLLRGDIEDSDVPTNKWYKRDTWNEWSR